MIIPAKIPKSYQFPNKIFKTLAESKSEVLSVLILAIYELKRSPADDVSIEYIQGRTLVDCSPLYKGKTDNQRRTIKKHLDYMCACGMMLRSGSAKSWLYHINPLVYHRLLKNQVDYYQLNFHKIHMFPPITIV